MQRHEDERGVVFRHADLEYGGDLVGLDPRRRAHRRHGAARRDQREIVAGAQRQVARRAGCRWRGPARASKPSSVPCLMLLAIEPSLPRSAARMPRTSTPEALNGDDASAWPSTIGAASRTPGTLEMRSATASQSVSGESSGWISRWPLRPRIFVEQFLAKAVHHRHDDDQSGNAEHDAEERKAGDDGDKSFFAPRPQIAQRQHPLEGRKGDECRSARSFGYRSPRTAGVSHDSGAFKPRSRRFATPQRTDSIHAPSIHAPNRASTSAGASIRAPRRRAA